VGIDRRFLFESQPPPGDATKDRPSQQIVVIPRNEHDLGIRRQRVAEVTEDGFGQPHRLGRAKLSKFQHIAHEHQAVYVAQGLEEPRARDWMTQHVAAVQAAKVRVGYDGGAHGRIIVSVIGADAQRAPRDRLDRQMLARLAAFQRRAPHQIY